MDKINHLISSFNSIAPQENRMKVFSDFVFLGSVAYQNQVFYQQELEDRYLARINRYSKNDVNKLVALLAELTMSLHSKPQDLLGQLYMQLDLGQKRIGQTFTPSSLQRLMAKLTFPNIESLIQSQGYIRQSEPCCGSGGMIIEFANHMKERGFDPSLELFVVATDLDINAVHMTYLQLSILNIPAQIVHGNTLTMEHWTTYATPALYTDEWVKRLTHNVTESNNLSYLEAV